mgnify:CR=1 FL=1
MNFFYELIKKLNEDLLYKDRYLYIFEGLKNTLFIAFCAAIIGSLIGFFIAIIKISASQNKKLKPLEILANIYLTVIRGTPVVVQLFITYYIILVPVFTDKIFAAVLAFGINSGAYVSEIIRAGIMSVDKGQAEAGRSLGLDAKTTMTKIIFPQAIKNILPAIGNEFITLLKETSVAGFIGIIDLSKAGDIIRSQTYEAFIPLMSVAAVYLVLVVGLTAVLSSFERRLRKSDIR